MRVSLPPCAVASTAAAAAPLPCSRPCARPAAVLGRVAPPRLGATAERADSGARGGQCKTLTQRGRRFSAASAGSDEGVLLFEDYDSESDEPLELRVEPGAGEPSEGSDVASPALDGADAALSAPEDAPPKKRTRAKKAPGEPKAEKPPKEKKARAPKAKPDQPWSPPKLRRAGKPPSEEEEAARAEAAARRAERREQDSPAPVAPSRVGPRWYALKCLPEKEKYCAQRITNLMKLLRLEEETTVWVPRRQTFGDVLARASAAQAAQGGEMDEQEALLGNSGDVITEGLVLLRCEEMSPSLTAALIEERSVLGFQGAMEEGATLAKSRDADRVALTPVPAPRELLERLFREAQEDPEPEDDAEAELQAKGGRFVLEPIKRGTSPSKGGNAATRMPPPKTAPQPAVVQPAVARPPPTQSQTRAAPSPRRAEDTASDLRDQLSDADVWRLLSTLTVKAPSTEAPQRTPWARRTKKNKQRPEERW